MKLLVTGSNGLLGQKIVYKLIGDSSVVLHAAARGTNRLLEQKGYFFHSLDITDAAAIEKLVAELLPDCIIHTAAMTNVDACEFEKETALAANALSVAYFANAIKEHSPQTHFVHLSTDFIFDGENGPYREDDTPNPVSYYGHTKLEGERNLYKSGINWAILRTIIVYGVTDNMSRSNIVLWAKAALEKGQPIKVVYDQFRSPTLAEDLADACISAARKRAKGIYHVSGKDIMSIVELVKRVADFLGLDKSLIEPVNSATLNQPAKRPPRTGFILDKAIRELDYRPHSFEEGIRIVLEQVAAHKKTTS